MMYHFLDIISYFPKIKQVTGVIYHACVNMNLHIKSKMPSITHFKDMIGRLGAKI